MPQKPKYTICPPSPGGQTKEVKALLSPAALRDLDAPTSSLSVSTYYWKNDEFELIAVAVSPAEARQMLRQEIEAYMGTSFHTIHQRILKLLHSPPTSIHRTKVAFAVVKGPAEVFNQMIDADVSTI